jgi:hypothetical protein
MPEQNASMKLTTFDAVTAARDPDVQKELLKMAKADNNPKALKHAQRVIALARAANKKGVVTAPPVERRRCE